MFHLITKEINELDFLAPDGPKCLDIVIPSGDLSKGSLEVITESLTQLNKPYRIWIWDGKEIKQRACFPGDLIVDPKDKSFVIFFANKINSPILFGPDSSFPGLLHSMMAGNELISRAKLDIQKYPTEMVSIKNARLVFGFIDSKLDESLKLATTRSELGDIDVYFVNIEKAKTRLLPGRLWGAISSLFVNPPEPKQMKTLDESAVLKWHSVLEQLDNYFLHLAHTDPAKLMERKQVYSTIQQQLLKGDFIDFKTTCLSAREKYKGAGGKQRFAIILANLASASSSKDFEDLKNAATVRWSTKNADFEISMNALKTNIQAYIDKRKEQLKKPDLFKGDVDLTRKKILIAETLIAILDLSINIKDPKPINIDDVIHAEEWHKEILKGKPAHSGKLGKLIVELTNELKSFFPIEYTTKKLAHQNALKEEKSFPEKKA